MEQQGNVLGGPNTVMSFGMSPGSQTPGTEVLGDPVDLTKPRPLPEHVNVFGPPSPGQEGYEAWKASTQGSGTPATVGTPASFQSAGAEPELPRDQVPKAVPLDKTPGEVVQEVAEPVSVPVVGNIGAGDYAPTAITFRMEGGVVKTSYPIVIVNELGTCLILAVQDPPPGVALFNPCRSERLEVVVGEGPNAVRYIVVSFDAVFKFGPWNMLVLAIDQGPEAV